MMSMWVHEPQCMHGGQRTTFAELVLSFHILCGLRTPSLHGKHFYSLSHLVGPWFVNSEKRFRLVSHSFQSQHWGGRDRKNYASLDQPGIHSETLYYTQCVCVCIHAWALTHVCTEGLDYNLQELVFTFYFSTMWVLGVELTRQLIVFVF